MSTYLDVIKEFHKKRIEKDVHYKTIKKSRVKALQELAKEADYSLDGRRRKNKNKSA